MQYIAGTILSLGCIGAGAWLATVGHPWFALLLIMIGASVRVIESHPNNKEKDL